LPEGRCAGAGELAAPQPRPAAGPAGRTAPLPDRPGLPRGSVARHAGRLAKTGRPAPGPRLASAPASATGTTGEQQRTDTGTPPGREPAACAASGRATAALPARGLLLLVHHQPR